MPVLSCLLAARPSAAVPPHYLRLPWGPSYFIYWDKSRCACVQFQASVLGVRATRPCVCLQETGGGAAKERLQFPSRGLWGCFCVTGCTWWQQIPAHRSWDYLRCDTGYLCSRAQGKGPWGTANQQPIHQAHTEERATGLLGIRWDGKQQLGCN